MKQHFIPGQGVLFDDEGLSLKEMAVHAHKEGFLSGEEFRDQGGVPALRRKIYDLTVQNRDFSRPEVQVDAAAQVHRVRLAKLTREANDYADKANVNDEKFIRGLVQLSERLMLKRAPMP